jgi:hypothetical protein
MNAERQGISVIIIPFLYLYRYKSPVQVSHYMNFPVMRIGNNSWNIEQI